MLTCRLAKASLNPTVSGIYKSIKESPNYGLLRFQWETTWDRIISYSFITYGNLDNTGNYVLALPNIEWEYHKNYYIKSLLYLWKYTSHFGSNNVWRRNEKKLFVPTSRREKNPHPYDTILFSPNDLTPRLENKVIYAKNFNL